MIARSRVGRLTTVATTRSAQSSSGIEPLTMQGAVAVDVGADAELVDDTELVRALGRRRAAAADAVDGEPARLDGLAGGLEPRAVSGSDG